MWCFLSSYLGKCVFLLLLLLPIVVAAAGAVLQLIMLLLLLLLLLYWLCHSSEQESKQKKSLFHFWNLFHDFYFSFAVCPQNGARLFSIISIWHFYASQKISIPSHNAMKRTKWNVKWMTTDLFQRINQISLFLSFFYKIKQNYLPSSHFFHFKCFFCYSFVPLTVTNTCSILTFFDFMQMCLYLCTCIVKTQSVKESTGMSAVSVDCIWQKWKCENWVNNFALFCSRRIERKKRN